MASIDTGKLVTDMLAAGSTAFKEQWPAVQRYASSEFQKIALQIADIERGYLDQQYSREVCDALLRLQKIASANTLLAMSGMTLLAVEAAINAVLDVVKGTVNTALGFALI
jgi:hypothetical protein